MQWLIGQQDAAQGFRTAFDAPYAPSHDGVVRGTVAEAGALEGPRVSIPQVAFDREYGSSEAVPVSGTWRNVDSPSAYEVAVYSVTDAAYLQGRFPLDAGGTWSSGTTVIHAGRKLATLVRRSDDAVVAKSGQPASRIRDVVVRVYSRTDVDYLQEEVPLAPDGAWRTTGPTAPGTKIARLVRVDTGRVLNSTEWADAPGYQGLVRSFFIPQGDPDAGYEGDATRRAGYRLEQRSFVYDDALAVLAFVKAGKDDRARAVLERLAELQNPDGSLSFSYDVHLGRVFEDYRRSGAIAWVGTAAVEYQARTGDTRFTAFAERLADYLRSLQVTPENGFAADDARAGSVLGGRGRYAPDGYTYVDEPMTFASTEHNIDAYFFFRDLWLVTGEERFRVAAERVKASLLTNHWNAAEGRFNQGVGDPAESLDADSWGGLFLLAIGEREKAAAAARHMATFRVDGASVETSADLERFNQTYSSPGPFSGYKPYLAGPDYPSPPHAVWAEGTWGALLLRKRLGEDISADTAAMDRLQAVDPRGGFLQMTRGARSLPYEFHAWPSVGGTAWSLIVRGDDSILWRPDGWRPPAGGDRTVQNSPPAPPPPNHRIQGVEVTQGSQSPVGVTLFDRGGATRAPYRGVPLARGGSTWVRVFVESDVDAVTTSAGPGVSVSLRVFDDRTGAQLGEVPVQSTGPPRRSGDHPLDKQELNDGGFLFLLPEAWAKGTLRLVASVVPRGVAACTTADCGPRTVDKIAFTPVRPFKIRLVRLLTAAGQTDISGDPFGELQQALDRVPQAVRTLERPKEWDETLDVQDAMLGTTACFLWHCWHRSRDDVHSELLHRLHQVDGDGPDEVVIGVVDNKHVPPGSSLGVANGAHVFRGVLGCKGVDLCWRPEIVVSVNAGRPLSNIAHELFHALSRPHAGEGPASCGGDNPATGQVGEDWPPGDEGALNSVGLDASRPDAHGFPRVIKPFEGGRRNYDLMSYCEVQAGDGNRWLSAKNWESTLAHLRAGKPGARSAGEDGHGHVHGAPPPPRVRAAAGAKLHVTAFRGADGVVIQNVEPQGGPVISGRRGGPQVVVYGADGKPVSSTPMFAVQTHVDGRRPTPLTLLEARVPAAGATRLAIVDRGRVVAQARAGAHRPTLRLLGLRAGTVIGAKRTTAIRWKAADKDRRDRLMMRVELSLDNGRRWSLLGIGPNRNRLTLLRSAIGRSKRARLRVTVSDGFHSRTVTSPPLRAAGTKG